MKLFNQSMLPYYLRTVALLVDKSNNSYYTLASTYYYSQTTLTLTKCDISRLHLTFNHETYSAYITVESYNATKDYWQQDNEYSNDFYPIVESF